MDTVAERVQRGVEWLDDERPDWHKYIYLRELDMKSECSCVLGQVFDGDSRTEPGFDVATKLMARGFFAASEVEEWEDAEELASDWAVEHGFDRRLGPTESYAPLQREWERVIEERRANDE